MKKFSYLQPILCFSLLIANDNHLAYAQEEGYLRLRRFQDVSQVPWKKEIYLFPDFQKGNITFATGFKLNNSLDLNYNIYYERVEFIRDTGDTLGIEALKDLKLVEIGNHIFYHDYKSGYYQVLTKSPVSLAVKPRIILVKTEGNCGAVSLSLESRGAVMDCDRLYIKNDAYFFIDVNQRIWKASPSSVFKLFPEHKDSIRQYVKENSVDFTLQQDLIDLLEYCNQK